VHAGVSENQLSPLRISHVLSVELIFTIQTPANSLMHK